MRQFLPNGYDAPRHCDVCGADESFVREGLSDWGSWNESPPKMTLEQELAYLKSFGIDDSTLEEMGYKPWMDDTSMQDVTA